MTPATIALLAQIIQLLVAAASQVPELIALGEQAASLLKSKTDPSPEQEAAIRAALDAANSALQAA